MSAASVQLSADSGQPTTRGLSTSRTPGLPILRSRFPVFGFRFSVLAFLLTFHGSLFTSPSWAAQAVEYTPGNPIVIRLAVGGTTEVVFPWEPYHFVPPDPQTISIERKDRYYYFRPLVPFGSTRIFFRDRQRGSIQLVLREVREGETEDDSVEITLGERPADEGPVLHTENPLGIRLIKAMMFERPLAGYKILDMHGDLFYEEPHHLQVRRLKEYEGFLLRGLVLEVTNTAAEAINITPEWFSVAGRVFVSVDDMHLAPREPADSVEAFKGYPKSTRAYVVVWKHVFDRAGGRISDRAGRPKVGEGK